MTFHLKDNAATFAGVGPELDADLYRGLAAAVRNGMTRLALEYINRLAVEHLTLFQDLNARLEALEKTPVSESEPKTTAASRKKKEPINDPEA